jgi:hypothetical protein
MMRYLLFAVASVLSAAEFQIDHATVAGSSMQQMQANLSAIGIASVYGGAHLNHATEMALVSFPDGSYLELMAIQPHADPAAVERHEWAKFLRGNAGPAAWALRAKDMVAEIARLKASGVTVSAPERSGRQRPDGVKLDWETASIGPETRGVFFPFLIHDFTPREQRVYPQGKPVTKDFRGVSKVVIAVRDLDEAVKRYRQAFGAPPPIGRVDKEFGARLMLLGEVPVVLAQPLTVDTWLARRIDQFGEGPCAFILAGARTGRYKAASKTSWFGGKLSWFDAEKLGWRLGFEGGE